MSDNEKLRRAVAAQGFAALAFFIFTHGAHAATLATRAAAHPAPAVHALTLRQRRS
jgi:predicted lipoprotein